MKTLRIFLFLSVGFGVGLIGSRFFPRSPVDRTMPPKVVRSSGDLALSDVIRIKNWSAIRTPDEFATLIEQLRNAGYPPLVIRAIVGTLINEKFTAQRRALLAKVSEIPYWKNVPAASVDFSVRTALRDLSRERAQLLISLLGNDAATPAALVDPLQGKASSSVPPEKGPLIQGILTDYAEMRALVRDQMGGIILAQDKEKLALLDKEERADLSSILTPDELTDFEMRNGRIGAELRSRLGLFAPSEQEFRALFKVQQAVEDQYGPAFNTAPKGDPGRLAAQEALQNSAKAVLSPERYQDYVLASDSDAQPTNRLLARYGFPIEVAREIKAVQNQALAAAHTFQAAPSSQEELNAKLAGLGRDTDAKLSGILGPEAYDGYKQLNAGWLRQLQPQTARTVSSRPRVR